MSIADRERMRLLEVEVKALRAELRELVSRLAVFEARIVVPENDVEVRRGPGRPRKVENG